MNTEDGCKLCRSSHEVHSHEVHVEDSSYWRLVVNFKQELLGDCFWVLRRHVEDLSELTTAEWLDLQQQLSYTAEALKLAFSPDRIDYAYLQSQDFYVHCHVLPRYAQSRTFAGVVLKDPQYPKQHSIASTARRLRPSALAKIALLLRARFIEVRINTESR